jgi:hypothetical protein
MALLLFSPKCTHSMDIITFVNRREQLRSIVRLHDVNQLGVPAQYRGKITRVPTMLTQNGKLLVGAEIKQWLASLLPVEDISNCPLGGRTSWTSLDGDGDDNLFSLDSYGQSLQPAMTPELQAKINKSVNEAYQNTIKK